MSQILANWLRADVTGFADLKSNAAELERDFANGYQFGLLLASLGLQDDFESHFVNGSTVDAIIKNYTSLESTLREKLSVRLSSSMALDLIHASPGSAAKLLYEIKTKSDALPQQKKKKGKSNAKNVAKAAASLLAATTPASLSKRQMAAFESYPSSPVDGESAEPKFIRGEEYHRSILPFDAQAIHHFGTVLKQKLKRTNEFVPKNVAPAPLPVKKQLPPIPKVATAPTREATAPQSPPNATKKRIFQTLDYQVDSDEDDVHASAAARDQLSNPGANELRIPSSIPPISNQSASSSPTAATASKVPFDPSDDYEQAAAIQSLPIETIGDFLKNRAAMDSSKHTRQLRKALDDSNALDPQDTRNYLEKIKIQKHEIDAARKEREEKRKKIMLAHTKAEQEHEKRALDQILINKLLRQSKQERRITEQLLQIRHEKEIMIENRIFREEQYRQARKVEHEEALELERGLFLNAQSEYRQQVRMQIEQYGEILEAERQVEHEKNLKWVRDDITVEIVNLALKSIEYKILHEKKDVPCKKLKEWKLMMLNNMSITDYQDVQLEKNTIPNQNIIHEEVDETITEIPAAVKVVDADEFNDYLNFTGNWESVNTEGLIKNHDVLGSLVDQLIIATKQPEERYPVAPIPTVPIRMALIGKRYSGKKSVAQFLAKKYNLSIINMNELIMDAVKQADINAKRKKGSASPSHSDLVLTKQQLGAKIRVCMMKGRSPDDVYLVQLLVEAMNQDPEPAGGWIIVDFPKTKSQAQLLERELSGYEDPKPTKKGDLKRTIVAKEKTPFSVPGSFRNRSLITYTDNPSDREVGTPVSGLDAVFLLEVSNEISFQRAAGQKIDPVTGETFHVENRPPPIDQPGTLERLASVEDPSREMQQLQYHLAAFEEEGPSLKDWINQFKTLQLIDCNGDIRDIEKEVDAIMNEIVDFVKKRELNNVKIQEIRISSEEDINKSRMSGHFQGRLSVSGADAGKDNVRRSADRRLSSFNPSGDHMENEALNSQEPLKKIAVSAEIGSILVDQWVSFETSYTETMKFSFRSLRKLLQDSAIYFYETKARFQNFLKRPDVEQELVDAFQKEYNALEEDFRADNDVKAELHQRVEELRERLWEIVDRRRDEAEAERILIIDDRWIEDNSYILANLLVSMIQAEADRYFSTRQFIIDYYKELSSVPITESTKPPVKIPFISLTASPPIEIGSALIAASEAAAIHRKDVQVNKDKPETPHKKDKEKGEKADKQETKAEKAAAKEKSKTAEKNAKQADTKVAAVTPAVEKEPIVIDNEINGFPDINSAIDYLFNILQSPDYSLEPLIPEPAANTTKDKKGAVEQKDDTEKVPAEAMPYLEVEEKMLRQRVERLKARVTDLFKDLKSKSLEVYAQLDDWILARYKVEIEATKDLTILFKEAIEMEQKLPNHILLSGEKLFLDYGTLVYEPEPEPRPDSPVEKQSIDQFTIAQLCILTNHLRQIAPSGIVGTKTLIDYFLKASSFAGSNDGLPESFLNAEPTTIQQAVLVLDPFDTGLISWRKFWLIQSKLLPIDLTQLAELKRQFGDKSAEMSKQKFFETTLWFEKDAKLVPGQFDRPGKAKKALFDVYSTGNEEFDKQDFLLTCCCDENPLRALEKAFLVTCTSTDSALLSRSQILSIFTHFLHLPKSTQRMDTTVDSETPYPDHVLQKIFAAALGTSSTTSADKISFSQFVDGCNKNGNQEWLQCPLYPLEDIATSSRPSSGKQLKPVADA